MIPGDDELPQLSERDQIIAVFSGARTDMLEVAEFYAHVAALFVQQATGFDALATHPSATTIDKARQVESILNHVVASAHGQIITFKVMSKKMDMINQLIVTKETADVENARRDQERPNS